jgi:hypothetical protein
LHPCGHLLYPYQWASTAARIGRSRSEQKLDGSLQTLSAIRRVSRERQFLSIIRFILRIGTQAMEPAILWFERRIHRVKRLTGGKLLRPCGGLSKGGDYTAFRPKF